MKRLLSIFMISALLFTLACEGPEGPAGAPGPQGPAGANGTAGPPGPAGTSTAADSTLSTIYQITGWNFTAQEDFGLGINFDDQNIAFSNTDALLIYRLWTVLGDTTTGLIPVWRMLPQTIYFRSAQDTTKKETLQYDFLFTPNEAFIFLDGTVDLTQLNAAWTTNQTFRFVVIPGEFGQRSDGTKRKINLKDFNVDYNDYNAVIKYFRLSDKKVNHINLR
jgi:hypothetical protein